jgi:hypothetical protein
MSATGAVVDLRTRNFRASMPFHLVYLAHIHTHSMTQLAPHAHASDHRTPQLLLYYKANSLVVSNWFKSNRIFGHTRAT